MIVGTRPLTRAVVVLELISGAASAQPARTSDADEVFDAAMTACERNLRGAA